MLTSTLPVTIAYSAKDNWRFKLGCLCRLTLFILLLAERFRMVIYAKEILLGEQVNIDTATFNFYNKERKFDWGFTGGV